MIVSEVAIIVRGNVMKRVIRTAVMGQIPQIAVVIMRTKPNRMTMKIHNLASRFEKLDRK